MTAHRAIIAAASPALRAAIQREQMRQPDATPLRIELGSHVQAADLRLLIGFAYSGVLRVPRPAESAASPRGLMASERVARRLAALAQALEMQQVAALLQVCGLPVPAYTSATSFQLMSGVRIKAVSDGCLFMQGTPPGLTSGLEAHSFGHLLPSALLHLSEVHSTASTGIAAQAPRLPAAFRLAAVPALGCADMLLAAQLRTLPDVADAAGLQGTGGRGCASWVAPEAIVELEGIVLIPVVACLLAARSPFFQTLLSDRWSCASGIIGAASADVLLVASPGDSLQLDSPATVCLPVVRLASDAEAVLQLLRWMLTGRMEPFPLASAVQTADAARCLQCRQLQTAVTAASLAGEWLMDSAQVAAEALVMRSPMSMGICCRRSVIEAAYAAHLEGLAHGLAKLFWAEDEAARTAEA